jgi:hypothetical protein
MYTIKNFRFLLFDVDSQFCWRARREMSLRCSGCHVDSSLLLTYDRSVKKSESSTVLPYVLELI